MRGFDHIRYNQELLLSLRMEAGVGTLAFDWAKPHHVCTLTGAPAWVNLANDLTVLNFVLTNPDYLLTGAAGSADLDFTTGDFAGCAWIRPDALGNRNIFTKGVNITDGWFWELGGTGQMRFYTNQAAASQVTIASQDVVVDVWQFVAFSRTGAVVTLSLNGAENVETAAVHVDPATAVARNLYIGVNNAAGAAWYDGDMWNTRIWGKAITAAEFKSIFERERALFGV